LLGPAQEGISAMDEFEWDENKRLSNLEKHYLDFYDAPKALSGPCLTVAAKAVNGEVREMAIGMLDDVCVTIIYTRRGAVTRLISMRKARTSERSHFEKISGG
jgi:uncharacterized DUF497 family protein